MRTVYIIILKCNRKNIIVTNSRLSLNDNLNYERLNENHKSLIYRTLNSFVQARLVIDDYRR